MRNLAARRRSRNLAARRTSRNLATRSKRGAEKSRSTSPDLATDHEAKIVTTAKRRNQNKKPPLASLFGYSREAPPSKGAHPRKKPTTKRRRITHPPTPSATLAARKCPKPPAPSATLTARKAPPTR